MGIFVKTCLFRISILFLSVLCQLNAVAADLSVPTEIRTLNVPSIDSTVGERLSRYLNVRSATVVGWQSSNMLIVTRFGETTQLHRVSQPMGFREQLTFFSEPIRGISIPKKGAEQHVFKRQ